MWENDWDCHYQSVFEGAGFRAVNFFLTSQFTQTLDLFQIIASQSSALVSVHTAVTWDLTYESPSRDTCEIPF